MDVADDVKKGKDHYFISKLITEYFSQKLFSQVHEIFVRKDDKDNTLAALDDDEDQYYFDANN
jgi:hypothetical protein